MLEASTRPAMVPGWWRRWPGWSPYAAMAWSVLYGALALSWAAGLLVIPDIRLPQNLAYGLLFVFVKLDWAVLTQGVIVLGGIFWAMTAISYRRKHAGAGTGRREAKVAVDRSPALMRWGKAATYAAFLLPLPYGITRLAWALGLPLGINQDLSGNPLTARIGEAGLATLAIGGGTVTLGLIRPWEEIWPRWIPLVGGRRVPVRAAVTAASLGTIFIFGVYAYALLNPIVRFRVAPDIPGCPSPLDGPGAWVAVASYAPLLAWGPLLAVVTVAYYRRRTHTTTAPSTTAGSSTLRAAG
jgi:hypothetical protein